MLLHRKYELYQDTINRLYPFQYSDLERNKKNICQIFFCTFQVTDACNLKCSYCYQINKGNHVMSLDVAKKFIDLLLDNDIMTQQYVDTKKSTAITLDMIGGEPFLQIELIDQICDYFYTQAIIKNHPWQYNWKISITSNGTLYFLPEVQNFIKKWHKFLALSISIDGNKELHDTCRVFPDGSGSYDIAIKAVHHYMEQYHEHMGSKMTLSPMNVQYTAKAVISLINEGYKHIHLNCVYEKGWTYEHAKILYQQLKQLANYILINNLEDQVDVDMFNRDNFIPLPITEDQNWCGGNGKMIAVDWKGDIFPCLRYMESSLGNDVPPIIIGNVNQGLLYNEQCKKYSKELKALNRINQSTEKCINCSIAKGCGWCQAYNYQDSCGILNHRATYICCMHKAEALGTCYFFNLLYQKHQINLRQKLWLEDSECLKIISSEELELLKLLSYEKK